MCYKFLIKLFNKLISFKSFIYFYYRKYDIPSKISSISSFSPKTANAMIAWLPFQK